MIPVSVSSVVLTTLLANNLILKLYSNNVIPTSGSSVSDFTETAGAGYVAKTLINSNWVMTAINSAIAIQPEQVFSFTGATTDPIYGYYITNVAGTELISAEALPAAISPFVTENGAHMTIVPQVIVTGG